jgi:hypothetical protein
MTFRGIKNSTFTSLLQQSWPAGRRFRRRFHQHRTAVAWAAISRISRVVASAFEL